jgi:hypothetical protein
MTLIYTPLLLALLALSGCAHGPAPEPGLPDSLTARINNDSTGTMLMRSAFLHTYANARCEGEERQASKLSMANKEALTTIPLKSGVPLTLALSTHNAQSFKGNWGCSVTSTFTPVAGVRYEAILQTEHDNRSCKLTILDQHKNLVPATQPDYSCHKTQAGISKNGRRYVEPVNIPIFVPAPR